ARSQRWLFEHEPPEAVSTHYSRSGVSLRIGECGDAAPEYFLAVLVHEADDQPPPEAQSVRAGKFDVSERRKLQSAGLYADVRRGNTFNRCQPVEVRATRRD